MKILLLGEFSGLHSALKAGLIKEGHKVTLVSFGDGFKKIDGDINIKFYSKNRIINRFEKVFKLFYYLPKFVNYDIVQVIHPLLILANFTSLWYVKALKKLNHKVIYNSCGAEPITVTTDLQYAYSPLQNEVKEGEFQGLFSFLSLRKYKLTKKIALNFDGIIGSMHTYHVAYKHFPNYLGFVPMPIERAGYKFNCADKNNFQQKVKIFHGITRSAFKGSKYIIEGMNRIKSEFPDYCDICIVEKVPYLEYLNLFDDCDIFIDQACSYGYGMNALLGLAKGKVVLSGREKEMITELKLTDCPIINIKPNSKMIYNTLKSLIFKERNYYKNMEEKALNYINNTHDQNLIAKRYLVLWRQI